MMRDPMAALDGHLELLARDEFTELAGHHYTVGVGLVTVGDGAESIHLFATEKDVHLHEVSDLFAVGFPVEDA